MSDWVPPGYISVTALVREHGVHSVRNDLFSERRQAFAWDGRSGELIPIEPRRCCESGAEEWLAQGWMRLHNTDRRIYADPPLCMVVVRVEDEPPPATNGVYVSPFVALMATAVQHFNIRAESCPEKKELVDHFCAQTIGGKQVTKNLAKQMATLCRPPEAMRGGNRKRG